MARRSPIRPGPGSLVLLDWVAQLGVAGIGPACAVLGLHRGTVYSHVARLARAGLLWRVPVHDGLGGAIVITRAGAREARVRGVSLVVNARSRPPMSARHGREVSWVAAYLQLTGARWVGPAGLHKQPGWRSQDGDGVRHAPDLGIVHVDGRRTAVEVELHAKSNARLDGILAGYRTLIEGGRLADVIYVTDTPYVAELVGRRAGLMRVGDYVHVRSLDRFVAGALSRADHAARQRLNASETSGPRASTVGSSRRQASPLEERDS